MAEEEQVAQERVERIEAKDAFFASGEGRKVRVMVREIKEILAKHELEDLVIDDAVFVCDHYGQMCYRLGAQAMQSKCVQMIASLAVREDVSAGLPS